MSDLRQRIAAHFPEYIGGTCLCGEEIDNVRDWADHVASALQPDIDAVAAAISEQIPSMGWNEANRKTVVADAARAAVAAWTGER